MDLDKFSVLSTRIERDTNRSLIRKKYKKNVVLQLSVSELKKLVDKYITDLKKANIPIPAILNSKIEEETIVYETKYCGKNIIELGFKIEKFDLFKNHIAKMAQILKKAMKKNIYFDPHPKNFVFDNNDEIFYVDFYPPYSDNLKKIRISQASIEHAEIIDKNFSFFTKDFLPEHFCGDFLNIDKKSECIFKEIYLIEKDQGISLNNEKDFINQAKYIRSIEDLRLKKNIYLL